MFIFYQCSIFKNGMVTLLLEECKFNVCQEYSSLKCSNAWNKEKVLHLINDIQLNPVIEFFMFICFCFLLQTFAKVTRLLSYQQQIVDIDLGIKPEFGFGAYFLYSPIQFTIANIQEQTSEKMFIAALCDQTTTFMIHYVNIDLLNNKIIHYFNLHNGLQFEYSVEPLKYEGIWYLFYFKYSKITKAGSILISDADKTKNRVFSFNSYSINPLKLKILYAGNFVQPDLAQQTFSFFRGLYFVIEQTQDFTVSETTLFSDKSSARCTCNQQSTVSYDNQRLQFTGQAYNFTTWPEGCYNFAIQSWIKLTNQKGQLNENYDLFQVSHNRFTQFDKYIGGTAFRLSYQFVSDVLSISIITYSYTFPSTLYGFSSTPDPTLLIHKFPNLSISPYQWHFFRFHSTTTDTEFQMSFPSQNTVLMKSFGRLYQFSVATLSVYIGGSILNSNYLLFQAYNITTFHCYTATAYKIPCDATCLTCDGPTNFDCLTCDVSKFRYYRNKQCPCIFGQADSWGGCVTNNSQFSIRWLPITLPKGYAVVGDTIECSYGYYLSGKKCMKCPSKINKNYIYCKDCLEDPAYFSRFEHCVEDELLIDSVFVQQIQGQFSYFSDNEDLVAFPNGRSSTSSIAQTAELFSQGEMLKISCSLGYFLRDNFCIGYNTQKIRSTECGFNCLRCDPDLRCLECSDSQKFFITSDKINCEPCLIANCNYCYLYDLENHQYQTLAQDFVYKERNSSSLKVACAQCQKGFSFSFQTHSCEKQTQLSNCIDQYKSSDGTTKCMLSHTFDKSTTILNCLDYIPNCIRCFLNTVTFQAKCLVCLPGFYASQFTGFCEVCATFRAIECLHLNQIFLDVWRKTIEPFFYTHYNTLDLYNNKTKVVTQQTSLGINCNLQYPEKKFCSSCQSIFGQPILSLKFFGALQLDCITCPQHCSHCLEVEYSQLSTQNLYAFSKYPKNIFFRCLMVDADFSDKLYIGHVGQVTICDQQQQPCKAIAEANRTLNCAAFINLASFRSLTNGVDFQIRVDVLKLHSVESLAFNYNLTFTGTCPLISYSLRSYLRAEVITMKVFSFALFGPQNGIINLEILFLLQEFTQLIFRNLTFSVSNRAEQNRFELDTVNDTMEVIFENVVFTNLIQFGKPLNILIKNPFKIKCENFTISNQLVSNTQFINLLYTASTRRLGELIFQNVVIKNCIFNNSILLSFNSSWATNALIRFANFQIINCTIMNSWIFAVNDTKLFSPIQFENIQIIGNKIVNSKIFQLANENEFLLSTLVFDQNVLEDSVIFQLTNANITKLYASRNTITQSQLIKQTVNTRSESQIFEVKIENNSVNSKLHLIQITSLDSFRILTVIDLTIATNQEIEFLSSSVAIFFVSGFQLQISRVHCLHAVSSDVPQIQIEQCSIVTITNLSIAQPNSQVRKLYPNSACFQRDPTQLSIELRNNQQISISDVIIQKMMVVSKPVLSLISNQMTNLQTVVISNCQIRDILMVKTLETVPLAIYFVEYSQNLNLRVSQIDFQLIFSHNYIINSNQMSSMFLSVNSPYSVIHFSDMKFQNLYISKSTDSIFQINCDTISIQNVTVQSVNVYNFNLFQRFVALPKQEFGFIKQQLLSKFIVESRGSFQQIKSKLVTISDSEFNNIIGNQGGVFYIETKSSSMIRMFNCVISNTQTMLSNSISKGGFLYLDSTNSQLHLELTDLSITSTFSTLSGGFIHINPSTSRNLVQIKECTISQTISSHGGFLHFSAARAAFSQVFMTNLQFIKYRLLDFIQFFPQISNSEAEDILSKNYLIDFENVDQIKLSQCYFHTLEMVSLLKLSNIKEIMVSELHIFQFTLSKMHFIQIFNERKDECKILISQMFISDGKFDNILNQQHDLKDCSIKVNVPPLQNDCSQVEISQNVVHQETSTDQSDQFNCNLISVLQYLQDQEAGSLLFLQIISTNLKLKINGLFITNLQSPINFKGLLTVEALSQANVQVLIQSLSILENDCGEKGCIVFYQQNGLSLGAAAIEMSWFISNQGSIGTAIYNDGFPLTISDCLFLSNEAFTQGGAIFNNNYDVQIIKSEFHDNIAEHGSAIFSKKHTLILDEATYISQPIGAEQAVMTQPIQLCLEYLQGEGCISSVRQEFDTGLVDEIAVTPFKVLGDAKLAQNIMLPSGQPIKDYTYFDQFAQVYVQYNYTFKIIALNERKERVTDLSGSKCDVYTRIFNSDSQQQAQFIFDVSVPFENESGTYNLEEHLFTFDPYLSDSEYLEIKIICERVVQEQYALTLKAKTFTCQMGEYYYYGNCYKCDPEKSYYSLDPMRGKCEIRNDQNTLAIRSSMINLKPGYWRYEVRSSTIEACINNELNCAGGWDVADNLCSIGHVGALCEECDINNIRGYGKYTKAAEYQCIQCQDFLTPVIKSTVLLLWTFFSIHLTGNSVRQSNHRFKILRLTTLHYKILYKQSIDQISIIIKQIMNFVQIVAAIQSFHIKYNIDLEYAFNFFGNPAKTMSTYIDCFLSEYLDQDIIYYRVLMYMIFPLILFNFAAIGYILLVYMGKTKYMSQIIWTYLLFIYILQQPGLFFDLTSLLGYREISETYWVKAQVTHKYLTLSHLGWNLVLVMPGVFLYGIFIPVMIFILLYVNRHRLYQQNIRNKYNYIINEYTEKSWFWELVKLLQRMLIITSLNTYSDEIVIKAALIVLVILSYSFLLIVIQPYHQARATKLETRSTYVQLAIIVLGIGAYAGFSRELGVGYIFLLAIVPLVGFQSLIFLFILCEGILARLHQLLENFSTNREKQMQSKLMNFVHRQLIHKRSRKGIVDARFKLLREHLKNQSKLISRVKSMKQEVRSTEQYQPDYGLKFTDCLNSPKNETTEQIKFIK